MTPTPTPEQPTVVYIAGAGRSGSTLLERLLGAVPGVATLGEVVHLPARGLVEGERCACGQPLPRCPLWGPVGDEAFGGWGSVDGQEWRDLQLRVDRNRHIPRLVAPTGSMRDDLAEHTDRLARLYRAAASVSGASVLVDSSKHASTAFVLRHLPDIPVRLVHLVRDSRGVAYSWTKEVARPETADDAAMPTYSPSSAAGWWDAFNVLLTAYRASGRDALRLRYEDLLDDPAAALRAVLAPTGLPLDDGWDAFLTPDGARLDASHSVAGNPMRFRTGTIPLRHDDAWRQALPPRDRRVVTALTSPFLLAYGYMRPRRSR